MITSQGCRVIPIEVLGVVGAVVAGLGLQGVVHWLLVLLGAGKILLVVERKMVLLLWWILLLLWWILLLLRVMLLSIHFGSVR